MSTTPSATNFIDYLGIEFIQMGDGRAELALDVQPHHLNSGRVLHGGALGSLVDTAAGAAAFSVLEKGQRVVTTDLHLTCIGNTGSGRVTAIATLTHKGSRFMHAQVRILAGEQLLASASVSFMVVAARAPSAEQTAAE